MLKKIVIGVLAVLVLLWLYVAYLRPNLILDKVVVQEKYITPNSHFISWNGTNIHYTESGSDTNMTVLMIHGFGGSHRDFQLTDSAINLYYHVIRVDLPGFGLSDFPAMDEDHPDYPAMYASFFSFLMDTLKLDSVYVMGNSMGGMMSWVLASSHPDKVKKLVLFNSAGYDMQSVVKVATGALRFPWTKSFVQRGVPEFVTKMGVQKVFYSSTTLTEEKIKRMNTFWNRKGNLDVLLRLASSQQYPDTALIAKIQCPTLIIWGKQDKLVPVNHASRFQRDIAQSSLIVYDSCGHVPMIEKPDRVKADVLSFLNR